MNEGLRFSIESTYSRVFDACDHLEEKIAACRDEFAAAGITFESAGISDEISALLSSVESLRGANLSL